MAEFSRMRPVTRFAAGTACLAAATALASGCSSNSAASSAMGDDAAIGCASDPRGEKFSIDMSHKGDAGMLSFVIAKANLDPPLVGVNTWTLKVLDANGQPVDSAMLTFPADGHPSDPWMPDHPHGDLPARYTNNNDGTYKLTPLYFSMGGIWSTYIHAQVGSVADSTTFTFCVQQ
jgi:hypothetical protein